MDVWKFAKEMFTIAPWCITVLLSIYLIVKNVPWGKLGKKASVSVSHEELHKNINEVWVGIDQHFSILHAEIADVRNLFIQHLEKGVGHERNSKIVVPFVTGGAIQK